MTGLLEAKQIQVSHRRRVAVQDVSFSVAPGSVLAVLGRNGAGKSSLLLALAGGLRPTRGQVWWKGQEVTRWPAHARVQEGLAYIPEGRRIFPQLTVKENLRLGGFWLSNIAFNAAASHVFDLFPALAKKQSAPAGTLSGGQQQMLALARALVSEPKLLLLDEPSLGLAPLVVEEVYARLHTLKAEGLAMVLVEQHVPRALALADEALVLHLGEVVYDGAPQGLVEDDRLVRLYMGAAERQ